jgi:class 3 adenylate cyclase/tetratricopeptide (TPR) repeat protein
MSSLGNQIPEITAKAERRNITVLFCDIVGSSALATKLDPEDLREILKTFRLCCESTIAEYDGYIARYMGDGILAYFGFPLAHEDDAERAVSAALQIVSTIAAQAASGQRIEVRVGIATGLVVVGDLIGEGPSREFALIGEAPNRAAALQQLARPNEILIAPQTQRLLGGLFDFEDIGEHTLKGQDHSSRLFRVLRARHMRSRFDALHVSGLTPFLGRESHLEFLQTCFEKARGGEGQIVTIVGEPGIGKSRLISNFCESKKGEDHTVILLQCTPHHSGSPWYPVVRYLEHAINARVQPDPSRKRENLERLIEAYAPDEKDQVIPLLAGLLSIPLQNGAAGSVSTPQQRKRATAAALVRMVLARTDQHPVVAVCEDVHWIDPSTLDLVDRLRQAMANRRVLLVMSHRPEFSVPWLRQPGVARIAMERLDRADARLLVGLVAQGRDLPGGVVDQIVSKTDGIPLFVEEVTKAILDSRVAGEPIRTQSIPDTLHDSLMARLDKVAPMKVIAQTAAAIGREFQLDLLEAVADARPEEVRGAIEGLLSAGLIFEHGDGARAYAFNHALVQEAAYSSMLREERRELHRRIAQALGEKFPDIVESHPELVAYHHSQARQMEAAVGFWLKAAQQAIKRSAFIEAIAHLQAALAQLSDVPQSEQRDRLELQLQESFVSASIAAHGFGSAQTTDALARALELCERSGDHLRTISVLNGMVGVHMMRGEFEKSLSVSQSLLERAETRSDATALLMSHRVLGMSLFTLGRIEEARAHLAKSIALYDPARHAPLALIYSHDFRATAEAYLGLATVVAGHVEAGLGHCHAALAYAEELRHPHSICYVLPFLTGAYLVAGRPREALPLAERAIALSSQYVFPQWQAGGLMLRGWARIDLGEAEGVEDVRKAIAGLEATGTLIWMRFAQFQLSRGIALSGDRQAAATLIEQNLRHLAGTSGRWYEAEVHRFKGDLIAEGDGPEAAAALSYEAAIDCAKRQGALLFQFHAMKALLSLRGARGNASALEAQATALRVELDERSGVSRH